MWFLYVYLTSIALWCILRIHCYFFETDDKELDRLSDLSLGSSVFLDADVPPATSSKPHKPSPPAAKPTVIGPPDLLHRAVVVGQKLAEADPTLRSESPVSLEKKHLVAPAEHAVANNVHRSLSEHPVPVTSTSFGTPALARRVRHLFSLVQK